MGGLSGGWPARQRASSRPLDSKSVNSLSPSANTHDWDAEILDCTVTMAAFPFVNVTVETKPLPNAINTAGN
jgi:hypothetical protein